MKEVFLFAVVLIVIIKTSSGQIRRNVDSTQSRVTNTNGKAQRMEMMQSLNLTKEQMGQLKELRLTQKQQRESITDDQNLSDAERQQKIKELHKRQKEKLKNMLTPEQMEILKEDRKNNAGERRKIKNMRHDMEGPLTNSQRNADSTK